MSGEPLLKEEKDVLSSLKGIQLAQGASDLAPEVQARVEYLQKLQGEHDELEKKFLEERAALEAKYQKLYSPLYAKRFAVVNGMKEPQADAPVSTDSAAADSAAGGAAGAPTDSPAPSDSTAAAGAAGDATQESKEKGIPEFWLTALKNHPIIMEQITDQDKEALKYLRDITWKTLDGLKGFQLDFHFGENPYFKNTTLSKMYHMLDEEEPILDKAIGTTIEWLPGKDLTQKLMKKKPKKGGKNAKPILRMVPCDSFFGFFTPPQVPSEAEDIEEEAAEELQEEMEQDYEIGSIIKEKIVPRAASWFTGEAALQEWLDMADDEEDEDFDDEDDDEDILDDEDDDEVLEDKAGESGRGAEDEEGRGKKGGKGSAGKAAKSSSAEKAAGTKKSKKGGEDEQGEQQPECKQQ